MGAQKSRGNHVGIMCQSPDGHVDIVSLVWQSRGSNVAITWESHVGHTGITCRHVPVTWESFANAAFTASCQIHVTMREPQQVGWQLPWPCCPTATSRERPLRPE